MFPTKLGVGVMLAFMTAGAVGAAAAPAHTPVGGGAAAPERPRIAGVSCAGSSTSVCVRGQQLEVRGEALDDARALVFLGRRGHHDDRRAAPIAKDAHVLSVTVPAGARSGRVRVISRSAGASAPGPTVRVARAVMPNAAPPTAPVSADGYVFPIAGAHDLGQSAANNFGGGRGHQGQDMFAACGTPVVAATAGTVDRATFEDRAGNYVVVTDGAGRSYVYMHMRKRPLVQRGQSVASGQHIGEVGETGRASGCHLHFELWTAPGWYRGGQATDPLPELRRWDAAS